MIHFPQDNVQGPPCAYRSACWLYAWPRLPLAAEQFDDKFRQLDELLPTPNTYRTASGAPGHAYWQQRADYRIKAKLDEAKRQISGSEEITYHNNSPDTLDYLWLQLDQNIYKKDSDARMMMTAPSQDALGQGENRRGRLQVRGPAQRADGARLRRRLQDRRPLKSPSGQPLKYIINRTMMRIDLPVPLKPGEKLSFDIDWSYNINEQLVLGGRSGYDAF